MPAWRRACACCGCSASSKAQRQQGALPAGPAAVRQSSCCHSRPGAGLRRAVKAHGSRQDNCPAAVGQWGASHSKAALCKVLCKGLCTGQCRQCVGSVPGPLCCASQRLDRLCLSSSLNTLAAPPASLRPSFPAYLLSWFHDGSTNPPCVCLNAPVSLTFDSLSWPHRPAGAALGPQMLPKAASCRAPQCAMQPCQPSVCSGTQEGHTTAAPLSATHRKRAFLPAAPLLPHAEPPTLAVQLTKACYAGSAGRRVRAGA